MKHGNGYQRNGALPEPGIQVEVSENLTVHPGLLPGIKKKLFADKRLKRVAEVGMVCAWYLVSRPLPNFNPRRE